MHAGGTTLAPPAGFRVPDLHDLVPGLVPVPRDPLLVQTTYYDTDDLRLARAGMSLRSMHHDGWAVELPGSVVGGVLVRREHRADGGPGAPPDAAVDLVRAWARSAPLRVVARLRTRRNRTDLVDPEGKLQAEVVDDDVSVLDGRRVAARFRQLEVVPTERAPADLGAVLVDALGAAGAGGPDPVPAIVRALGPRALAPPDVAAPPDRRTPSDARSMTAGDAVRDAIARSVHRLLAHDPGVRLGDDPEFVHQARVATRRLRSDLRTFRSLVDPGWARGLREELRWIAAVLGAVRDTEVLLELLREKAGRLPAVDRPVADQLLGVLVGRWEEERIELLGAMRSARYVRLLDRLVDAAREPRFASPHVGEPARGVLAPLVRGPWSHLRKAVEALDDHPSEGALHGVRIRAKRCRYAAEAVAPAVGGPARRFARRIAALQDVLGRHHDATVAAAWLREVSADAPVAGAFAAGALAGMVRLDAQAARAEWPAVWSAARRKKLRRWW